MDKKKLTSTYVGDSFLISSSTKALFESIVDYAENFMQLWARYAMGTKHVKFTTSQPVNLMRSFELYIEGILATINAQNEVASFKDLIHQGDWAQNLLAVVRRHYHRGIATGMFLGRFKTSMYALIDTVELCDVCEQTKVQAVRCIRRFADAYETLLTEDLEQFRQEDAMQELAEQNRHLGYKKCKYENILKSISELVLVLNEQGQIIEANAGTFFHLKETELLGRYVWEFFPLGVTDMLSLISRYENKTSQTVTRDDQSFDVALISLKEVSLTSNEYLMVFADVSIHLQQKALLENLVTQRTSDLLIEKQNLEEMNITLKNVLSSIEQQKEDGFNARTRILKEQISPVLKQLKTEKSKTARDHYIDLLERKLGNLCDDKDVKEVTALSYKLTPIELNICHMLRDGVSTKNIAQTLNLSIETIRTHRKHIRHKLGINGEKVSLFNYLSSLRLS